MTTADWALIISLFSAAISLASFVWNVWSKFIYPKPRVRVNFSMVTAFYARGPREENPARALMLSATNFGPESVTLRSPLIKFKPHWFSETSFGILNTLPGMPMSGDADTEYELGGGPFAGGFPKTLGVGESFRAYLVPDHETLAKGDYERIGFDDSFDRMHWASRRSILETLPRIREACERSGKDWRSFKRGG